MIFETKIDRLKFLQVALEDYETYFRQFVWPTLNPFIPLADSPAITFMCQLAQAWYNGKYRLATLALPPRNTKTTIFTIGLFSWIWLKKPHVDLWSGSANDEVLQDFYAERNLLLESEDYQAFWQILYATDSCDPSKWVTQSVNRIDNSMGGKLLQWRASKSRTGLGFHYGILDDPIAVSDAYYPNHCNKIHRETVSGHMNRRHDKDIGNESPLLIVQQRVSPYDLIGRFEGKEGWSHFVLPAIAYEEQEVVMPLTGEVWVRQPGSVLNPDRESLQTLLKIRDQEERLFWTQFQQKPQEDTSEQVVTPEELKYYSVKTEEFDEIILTVDTAASTKSTAANWGMVVIGKHDNQYDAIYAQGKRYNYPNGKREVIRLINDLGVTEVYVEDKSTGLALVPELKEEFRGQDVKIIGVEPGKVNKEERFMCALPYLKSLCRFPKLINIPDAVWSMPLMAELTSFPNSPTKDLSDALSQYFYHKYYTKKKRPSLKSFYNLHAA